MKDKYMGDRWRVFVCEWVKMLPIGVKMAIKIYLISQ